MLLSTPKRCSLSILTPLALVVEKCFVRTALCSSTHFHYNYYTIMGGSIEFLRFLLLFCLIAKSNKKKLLVSYCFLFSAPTMGHVIFKKENQINNKFRSWIYFSKQKSMFETRKLFFFFSFFDTRQPLVISSFLVKFKLIFYFCYFILFFLLSIFLFLSLSLSPLALSFLGTW